MHRSPSRGPVRASAHLRRGFGRLTAVLAVSLLALTGVQALGEQPARAAAAPLLCDQSTIYGISTGRAVKAITVDTGASAPITTLTTNNNALGVSADGLHAYAFSSGKGANTLEDFDTTAGSAGQVMPYTPIDSHVSAIRGAVNPANGLFYYADSATAGVNPPPIYLGAYDPATHQGYQVGWISVPKAGSGGDIAFSRNGVLLLLTGNMVYRIDDSVPSAAGAKTLTGTLVTTISDFTNSPGMAFASNGYLYASSGSRLKQIDPSDGSLTDATPIGGNYVPNDLASCNYPDPSARASTWGGA